MESFNLKGRLRLDFVTLHFSGVRSRWQQVNQRSPHILLYEDIFQLLPGESSSGEIYCFSPCSYPRSDPGSLCSCMEKPRKLENVWRAETKRRCAWEAESLSEVQKGRREDGGGCRETGGQRKIHTVSRSMSRDSSRESDRKLVKMTCSHSESGRNRELEISGSETVQGSGTGSGLETLLDRVFLFMSSRSQLRSPGPGRVLVVLDFWCQSKQEVKSTWKISQLGRQVWDWWVLQISSCSSRWIQDQTWGSLLVLL